MKNGDCFEEIMKCLGYKKIDCDIDSTAGKDTNECKNLNLDILGGFQDVEPILMVLIAEVLANAISGDLPAIVMNALGNWLQLVGQVIQLYNSQQQYFQSGPGRYYDKGYKMFQILFVQTQKKVMGEKKMYVEHLKRKKLIKEIMMKIKVLA